MKILELTLYTNQLENVKKFYSNHFETEISEENNLQFSIQLGWTKLTFIKNNVEHFYHYALMVSKSQFQTNFQWALQNLDVLETEENEYLAYFENWNAQSFYFYDGAGNLAEIIAHDDIDFSSNQEFTSNAILGISEIGLPTTDIKATNFEIETLSGSTFWKGDYERFGTNGSAEGKILLPNYHVKKTWFPTNMEITPTPLKLLVEVNGKISTLSFLENNK
jgi:hypothetical protein